MSKLKSKVRKSPRRWHVISKLIEENGWTSGVELGVLDGRNLIYLLARHPELEMLAVDPWRHNVMEETDKTDLGWRSYRNFDLDALFEKVGDGVRKINALDRVTFARMTGDEAAGLVLDMSTDFVFIDADHTYGAVKNDIIRWAPKIRPGGMLMGHDASHPDFPGVDRALKELLPYHAMHDDHVWSIPIEDVKL